MQMQHYHILIHLKSKNILPIVLEIVFVVIGVIGFGIFTYGFGQTMSFLCINELTIFHPLELKLMLLFHYL
jgi:hypothetical protein